MRLREDWFSENAYNAPTGPNIDQHDVLITAVNEEQSVARRGDEPVRLVVLQIELPPG